MQETNPMCAMLHVEQVLNSSVGTVALFEYARTDGIAVVNAGLLGEALLLRFAVLLYIQFF